MSTPATVSPEEKREAKKRERPRSVVIFEAIRGEGDDELERSPTALMWSGIAAGLSMAFSLIAQGTLEAHLPDAPWKPLVASFGYSIGFLIVILGRQQLFTENTLTPILPLFSSPDAKRFGQVARLWAIVLCANLVAALIASAFIAFGGAFDDDMRKAFTTIGLRTVDLTFMQLLTKAIFAGWLIALMVWLLPLAETATPFVIIILTYILAAAGFSHIIAGSIEAMYVAWTGASDWAHYVAFAVPTLLGNIIGGVGFVASVSFAEIAAEKRNPTK